MTARFTPVAAICLLGAVSAGAQEQNADSLAYAQKREEILRFEVLPEGYETYLEAGEELAREGMFAEACDVISELFAGLLEDEEDEEDTVGLDTIAYEPAPVDSAAPARDSLPSAPAARPPEEKKPARKPLTWRIGATVSYDLFDDDYLTSIPSDTLGVDTTIPDSLLEVLDEIDDRPLNGNARVRLDWRTGLQALARLSPYVYLSNTRARAGLSGEGSWLRKALTYDAKVEGEKKFGEDYGDSSDLVEAEADIELSSDPLGKLVSVALPIELEGEYYRTQRSQYTSFVGVTFLPTFVLRSSDFGRRLALSFEYERLVYHPSFNEDDERRYGPHLAAELWTAVFDGNLDILYDREQYPKRTDPRTRRVFDAELRCSAKPVPWLEVRLDGTGFWERERTIGDTLDGIIRRYVETVDTTGAVHGYDTIIDTAVLCSYGLRGYGGEASVAMVFSLPLGFSVVPQMSYENRQYPQTTSKDSIRLYFPLSISEAYVAYEPEMKVGFNTEKLEIEAGYAYRIEDAVYELYTDDSRSHIPSLEFRWSIAANVTMDSYAEFRHRILQGGERENDVSAFISMSLRF